MLHGHSMAVYPETESDTDLLYTAEQPKAEVSVLNMIHRPMAEVSVLQTVQQPVARVAVMESAPEPTAEVTNMWASELPAAKVTPVRSAGLSAVCSEPVKKAENSEDDCCSSDTIGCEQVLNSSVPDPPQASVTVIMAQKSGISQNRMDQDTSYSIQEGINQNGSDRSTADNMEEGQKKTTEYTNSAPDSETIRLQAAAEAILFTMGDAVPVADIARALNVEKDKIISALESLEAKYNQPGSGIMLQRFENSVQMCTRPEQYENLVKIASVPRKMVLTNACIETLSIIAYKQPVTRVEIEDIRGVSCGYAIDRLLEFNLIEEKGRRETIGRPILFGTTQQFLRSFGLSDLSQLPQMANDQVQEFRQEAEKEIDDRLGV